MRVPSSSKNIVGVGIVHHKSREKQLNDWKREEDLYEISAKKYAAISPVESRTRPVIVHYMRTLSLGGTEKMCQLLLKYMNKDKFENFVSFIGYEDNPRREFFEQIVGEDHMIPIAAAPEFGYILRDMKIDILEKYASGIPEWPFLESNRKLVDKFISTFSL